MHNPIVNPTISPVRLKLEDEGLAELSYTTIEKSSLQKE